MSFDVCLQVLRRPSHACGVGAGQHMCLLHLPEEGRTAWLAWPAHSLT